MQEFMEWLLEAAHELSCEIVHSIFDTEVTETQKRANELVIKIYTVAANLIFVIVAGTLYLFLLAELGVLEFLTELEKYSVGGPLGLLILIVLSLVFILGLLKLFQFIRAAELAKLYAFVELIHVSVTYISSGTAPAPWLVVALRTLFGGNT